MSCKYETEWCKTHAHCETCSHYEVSNLTSTQSSEVKLNSYNATFRVPKEIARVKLCGEAITFHFYDNDPMPFEAPTKEQRENLKKTFGIVVELIDKD